MMRFFKISSKVPALFGAFVLCVSCLMVITSCSKEEDADNFLLIERGIPDRIEFSVSNKRQELRVGDNVKITVNDDYYDFYTYEIDSAVNSDEDVVLNVLQGGDLGVGGNEYVVTLSQTDYRGRVYIFVIGHKGEKDAQIGGRSFKVI